MWISDWLDPNYLDYWPFGIFTEKAILRISIKKIIKKTSRTRIFSIYSGHRWILGASELVSSFFQYSNLQHRGKKGSCFLNWRPLHAPGQGQNEKQSRWIGAISGRTKKRTFFKNIYLVLVYPTNKKAASRFSFFERPWVAVKFNQLTAPVVMSRDEVMDGVGTAV